MFYNIHFSPTGGTKKVADIIANSLTGNFQSIDLCREISPMEFNADDVCLISVPSYGGRVPTVNMERLKKFSGNGAKAILNCVYGNRHWEDTLTELQDLLEQLGFVCVAGIAAVAEHSILRMFGKGRPDNTDANQLCEFAKKIQNKLDSNKFDKLELSGNHDTYKVFNGTPIKPQGDDKCISCGACVAQCPAGAIIDPHTTDKNKCISCMRCIGLCPAHARDLDPAMMLALEEKMSAVLSGRKDNFLFL